MWSARVFLQLFAFCLYVYGINGTCDPEVVEKIKDLGIDPSKALQSLQGEYIIYHFASGNMDEDLKQECLKLKFYQNGHKHMLEYVRFIKGAYTLQLRGDAFVHIKTVQTEKEPEMTYYTFINDLDFFGVYVCNKEEEAVSTDLTLLAVPVKRPTVELERSVLEAKKLVAELGLPTGVDSVACFKGENGNPGECKMAKRTYYVVDCPPSVQPPASIPVAQ